MRVGLEISSVAGSRRSGVGNYVATLVGGLQHLSARGEGGLDLVYFSNRTDYLGQDDVTGLSSQAVYPHDRLPIRSLWMQFGLPRSLSNSHLDLCHFPNYLAPIIRKVETPYLATMYDMSIYRCPQYQAPKTVAMHRAIVPSVARSARTIVTISQSARQDILHYLKIEPERVRVVHASLSQLFSAVSQGHVLPTVAPKYNLDFPYILSVGTLEPRKNHTRLIAAFAELVRQERLPHHLVMVGGQGWKDGPLLEQLRECGVTERVHRLGYVPDADLPGLYAGADAFAFPSFYEGFGLPVLEAMACGTPTLISTDPALQEIGGGAALAVNPYSTHDIAAGLHALLTDHARADQLRTMGRTRAAEFGSERCAAEYYQLYQEVLDASRLRPHFVTSAADSATPVVPNPPIIAATRPVAPTVTANSPTALEQAIVETVLYADIFNFPLTAPEIQRYLIGQSGDLATVENCLATSGYLQTRLAYQEPYYALTERPDLFEQRAAQTATVAEHWRIAERWCKRLRLVPFLRSVVITGSLAAGSARPKDDIDLLLLVEPGRVWTCRAITIGFVYLARLRGIELCPNYLIALDDAPMTLLQHDLYNARELAAMRLMFGPDEYFRLLGLNDWMGRILPNAVTHSHQQFPAIERDLGRVGKWVKRTGERLLRTKLGAKLENWEQRKIRRLSQQDGAEACFTPDLCKGHFGNYGTKTLAAFAQRCQGVFHHGDTEARR